MIYVKNFMLKEVGETEEVCPENDENTQKYENQTSRSMENEFQEVPKLNVQEYGNQTSESIAQEFAEIPEANFKKYENQTSASMKSELQEVPKSNFKKCENQTSGGMKIKFPEVRKSNGNNTDINETEYSETEFNDTDNSDTADSLSNPSYPAKNEAGRMMDVMEQINVCRELIRKNIAYETFGNGGHREREEVDELVELMTEVMMLPDEAVVRISGTEKPAGIVKSQFMKIGQAHIQYVMGCLGSNTTKVGNIKSYLLTALYNSVMTMEHYYRAEVNHNMYGGACR